ncbi:hypothetical protein AYO38_03135 [bacterium SCGC AG-212-C10]|nr:hypothetical protein AYO38_03135 [bacterium SCGC AG-212-C10]
MDATTTVSSVEVAAQLFSAIQQGDLNAVHDLYAPDVAIWHNTDGITQGREDNLRVLRWLTRTMRNVRYEDVRVQPTPAGFVQQHVLRATTAGGKDVELPACIICDVVDGKITRLAEYLDSAAVAQMRD